MTMYKFAQRELSKSRQLRPRLASVRLFHQDERGLEALQVVMILAVAAVCLQVIKYWWPWWREFLNLAIDVFVE
jgi:hypothetical protein